MSQCSKRDVILRNVAEDADRANTTKSATIAHFMDALNIL